jgi:hypothetical protein
MSPSVLQVNGSVVGAGPYRQLSDSRLKTDVRELDGALAQVLALRSVSYRFDPKSDPTIRFPSGKQLGFVAQELQRVLPEAVSADPNGHLSVAYDTVVPVLVRALQEQQRTIDGLAADVAKLRRAQQGR